MNGSTVQFRVKDDDRRLVEAVAVRLDRTVSDAARYLFRQAARDLGVAARSEQPKAHEERVNATA